MAIRTVITRGYGNGTFDGSIAEAVLRGYGINEADTTAPSLSSPTGTAPSPTTAYGTVETDEANGTLYYYVSANSSELAATIKASGESKGVSVIGAQEVTVSGLTAETAYYLHYVQDDAATNESNVVSSAEFTTPAVSTATEETNAGGWWFSYEQEMLRRQDESKQRAKKKAEAQKVKDKVDQELALEFRRQEEEEARTKELQRLTALAETYQSQIKAQMGAQVNKVVDRAVNQKNFSAMEALEREFRRAREEEEFLRQATMLILQ